MAAIVDYYDRVFVQTSDTRVNDWLLMSSPFVLLGVIAAYLYMVYFVLPTYMDDRKPFDLKNTILVYNVFQVVACIALAYGLTTSGWTTHYTFGCELVDYSENKLALRMASFMWWAMMLKLVELIETAFFILRKKYNQVSKLHVYHHASTFTICWLATKYHAGGMLSLPIIMNCFIHMLMYTYYFLSAFGPEIKKKLEGFKNKLTLIQMFQLVVIFVYIAQAALPSCNANKLVPIIFLPNLAINFALFLKFYIKSYTKKKNN